MNAIVEQLLAGELREAGRADIVLEAARWAAASFAGFRHEQVIAILQAAAAAASADAGRYEDFCSPRPATGAKAPQVPRPLGVVLASIPSTASVAAIHATLRAALATRNAIVLALAGGTPAASIQAVRAIAAAAEQAGAPACTVQMIEAPSPALADHLAKSAQVNKVLDGAVVAETLVTWSKAGSDGAPGARLRPPALGREAPITLGKLQEGALR